MNLDSHIFLDHLSHAYVIEGERDSTLSALRKLIESFGVTINGNPDYHEYQIETLLLEHAQAIRREQSMKGAEESKKIFVVAFNSIIIESQNALLKTLEEPTEDTHFFFIVRTSEILLPTVRSRMQIVRGVSGDSSVLPLAQKFILGNMSTRLKLIEKMTKVKPEQKAEAKEEARVFVSALEPLLYEKLHLGGRNIATALEDVITAKRELSSRSPSVKLLLEHLAMTLPRV